MQTQEELIRPNAAIRIEAPAAGRPAPLLGRSVPLLGGGGGVVGGSVHADLMDAIAGRPFPHFGSAGALASEASTCKDRCDVACSFVHLGLAFSFFFYIYKHLCVGLKLVI